MSVTMTSAPLAPGAYDCDCRHRRVDPRGTLPTFADAGSYERYKAEGRCYDQKGLTMTVLPPNQRGRSVHARSVDRCAGQANRPRTVIGQPASGCARAHWGVLNEHREPPEGTPRSLERKRCRAGIAVHSGR